MEAKIILVVMKFDSPSLPGLLQPFNYQTTQPGSVDRNVVIENPLSKIGQYLHLDTLGRAQAL